MKKKDLKINKKTIKSLLDDAEMDGIKGGAEEVADAYSFSLINGCSDSLCVSHKCGGIGFTVNKLQCCSPK